MLREGKRAIGEWRVVSGEWIHEAALSVHREEMGKK